MNCPNCQIEIHPEQAENFTIDANLSMHHTTEMPVVMLLITCETCKEVIAYDTAPVHLFQLVEEDEVK